MPNSYLQTLQKSKKSAFPSGCIFGILLSWRLDYRPKEKQKLRYFLIDQYLKWAKEQAKKNRENVRKKNHPFSKIKGFERLAWGHCEKSYNTWPFPMAVSRPCRNQIIRHCPQDAFFEHFYLRDWIIDRKKNSFLIDEGLKWVKYRLKKNKSHHFSKNKRPQIS